MTISENISGSPDIEEPIDLIAFAKETTRRDIQRIAPDSVKVIAPAKVNLFLGVGQARADGYHDVANVLHAIMLHDVLYLNVSADASEGFDDNAAGGVCAGEGLRITVQCVGFEGIEVPDVEAQDNLAYRAVAALACELGRTEDEHVHIRIEKHIPHQAGLGGGSADAAAALLGAAQLWGVQDASVLERVATRIGSDVAFFLQGGCAYYTGRGEAFHHALTPRKDNIVLIKPELGLSTGDVYREFDAGHCSVSDEMLHALAAEECASGITLYNNLTEPAERLAPELACVRKWAATQSGAVQTMLCGSGAASFVLCDDFAAACSIAAAAKLEGWWARTTMLCAAKAAVAGT